MSDDFQVGDTVQKYYYKTSDLSKYKSGIIRQIKGDRLVIQIEGKKPYVASFKKDGWERIKFMYIDNVYRDITMIDCHVALPIRPMAPLYEVKP